MSDMQDVTPSVARDNHVIIVITMTTTLVGNEKKFEQDVHPQVHS